MYAKRNEGWGGDGLAASWPRSSAAGPSLNSFAWEAWGLGCGCHVRQCALGLGNGIKRLPL